MTTRTVRRSYRLAGCTRPPLRLAVDPALLLRQDITAVCAQIDRRTGNPVGTAERGTYYWLWPPADVVSLDVLRSLHRDAVDMLHDITHRKETDQ